MNEGHFDYIIIGAGSAGCVLANRLSANPRHRVLLLEAGPRDTSPWIHIPLGYGKLFKHPVLNWGYETAPEPFLDGRKIAQPRGRVIGGSSSTNGLVYVRGQREDFDGWRNAGHVGWSYDDLLPYFIRAEDQAHGAGPYHGAGGPLTVSDPAEPNELCEAFIAAAMEAGHPRNTDFNGATQEGVGYYQATMRRGRRVSAAVAYLRPVTSRNNLHVLTGALVRRVLFDGRKAVGVEWQDYRGIRSASAAGEILLAAGAINTPQVLQLSGVGSAEHLKGLGIEPRHNLPSVGLNLQDHIQARTVWRSTKRCTLNDEMMSPWRTAKMGLRYLLSRKGSLTISAGYAGGFFRSSTALDNRPNVQVLLINFSTDAMGTKLHRFSGFTASVCPLRPHSRGHVRILSPDPSVPPEIQVNFLADARDQEDLISGLRVIESIMSQPAIAPFIAQRVLPESDVRSDQQLLAYARRSAGSIYHATCTAALGAVVDDQLRVKGLDSIRVIDASIMPSVVSGNTNAAVIAIAEKGADLVLQKA